MIKLIKILGKCNNLPEIEEREVATDVDFAENKVYYITEDGVTPDFFYGDTDPKFYVTVGRKQGDKNTTVKGFFVTPDMIFEVDVDRNPTKDALKPFMTVCIAKTEPTSGCDLIFANAGESVIIYDPKDQYKDKCLVKLV